MSTLSKKQTESLTIVLSDEAANYIHQRKINNVDDYINQLLWQAKNQNIIIQKTISESAPDASGYPQI